MNLIFKIKPIKQKGRAPVEVILEEKGRIISKETAESADKVLERLDRILKRNKMGVTDIKSIKTVDNFNKISYTSRRILKSIEKALKLKLS